MNYQIAYHKSPTELGIITKVLEKGQWSPLLRPFVIFKCPRHTVTLCDGLPKLSPFPLLNEDGWLRVYRRTLPLLLSSSLNNHVYTDIGPSPIQ